MALRLQIIVIIHFAKVIQIMLGVVNVKETSFSSFHGPFDFDSLVKVWGSEHAAGQSYCDKSVKTVGNMLAHGTE